MSEFTDRCEDCGVVIDSCGGYVYWTDTDELETVRHDVCGACYDAWAARRSEAIGCRGPERSWRSALTAYRAVPKRIPFAYSVPAWHYADWWRRVTKVEHG